MEDNHESAKQSEKENIQALEKPMNRLGGFKPIHVLLPVLIGIGVVVWMFADEFKNFDLSVIHVGSHLVLAFVVVLLMVVLRELGMTWRYRSITDCDLSWWQAFKVCIMCEFTSAVTPSAVGGSSLAMIFMNREGINFGRATTLMIVTLFLDELFFVLFCPIITMITSIDVLFGTVNMGFTIGLKWVFWGIYAAIALWTLILFLGIMVRPQFIRAMLVGLFKFRLLRRWLPAVEKMGDNMVATSIEVKHRSFMWWLKAFGGTVLLWVPRYLLVCALFWGFVEGADQWLVFARQAVVWLILMVCPTPGGSGVGEWLFTQYYADMVPTAALSMVIMFTWRIISYYIYLIVGLIFVPLWLKPEKDKKKQAL